MTFVDPQKSLPAWDRIITLSLITIVRMGYSDIGGGGDDRGNGGGGDEMRKNMQRVCQLGASIASASTSSDVDERENIVKLWQLFKEEVAQHLAIVDSSVSVNDDDSEANVDEEIKK